ncbi:conserved hypothetical protein [Culex quinquefasciatus]|uniref:GH18 domain-containing protein n=1 Tax=Culex quinquefasciatus TaxID=7176 RepID=B0XEM4_CULQU|nr:conserved hypothetical protein [Culex quinquefasciatus]|eukprot:XP_001868096.1 conserved hypothetical protein [Culex quinquefasciatus]
MCVLKTRFIISFQDYHVTAWKLAGLTSDKIVIGVQTNSITYKLIQPNEYRLGTPVAKLKIRPFYKICQKLYAGSLEIFEEKTRCPYAFRDQNWYSYENQKSISEKVEYVVGQSLAGIAVMYYDEDDPINTCGDGPHPLTTAILSTLEGMDQPATGGENPSAVAQRSVPAVNFDSYEEYANVRIVDQDVPYSVGAPPAFCDGPRHPAGVPIETSASNSGGSYSVQYAQPGNPGQPGGSAGSGCASEATTTTTTPAPSCGYQQQQQQPGAYQVVQQFHPDQDDNCDEDEIMEEAIPVQPSGPSTPCPPQKCPQVILANSDQALNRIDPVVGAKFGSSGMGSAAGSAGSSDPSPLFSEPVSPLVVRPPPKGAQFDPKNSRLGIIATSKIKPGPNSSCAGGGGGGGGSGGGAPGAFPPNSQGPMINLQATATFQTSTTAPQGLADLMSNMESLANMLPKLAALKQTSLGASSQLGGSGTPFGICPFDGIIPDARNPKFYYLCRRGL